MKRKKERNEKKRKKEKEAARSMIRDRYTRRITLEGVILVNRILF